MTPVDETFLAATQSAAGDSDVELSDDDMELLNEFGTFSSFLTQLNPHDLLKYVLICTRLNISDQAYLMIL